LRNSNGGKMHPYATSAIVQKQCDARDARDVNALVAVYADDAQLIEYPLRPLASGSAQLRERFAATFREPSHRVSHIKRITMGRFIVDHERVTRAFPEGAGTMDSIVIYDVENDKIARTWTISGVKKLDE
jgi:hypothetical protein